jgi:hypothetical protein
MDKMTYFQEAERQLSDCRIYEKLDSDRTVDFTQKITRALEAMHVTSVVFSGMVKFSIFFK